MCQAEACRGGSIDGEARTREASVRPYLVVPPKRRPTKALDLPDWGRRPVVPHLGASVPSRIPKRTPEHFLFGNSWF